MDFPNNSAVKNPPAVQDTQGWSLGQSSLGRQHGNPLQYSCLENAMDKGSWWAAVHGVTKSRTGLEGLDIHMHPGLS